MKKLLPAWLALVTIVAICSSGCVVHRTVTKNGQEVSSGYAIKRPIKEAIDNSRDNSSHY